MSYPNRQDYFEARDIERLLNINKDQLYHWVKLRRLIIPEVEEGQGRGGRSKFSFKNLLDLSLIKDLYELKFEFIRIHNIMKTKAPLYDPIEGGPAVDWDELEKIKTDIWESFSSNRPEFVRDGYILVISKGREMDRVFAINEKKFYKLLYKKSPPGKEQIDVIQKPLIIIDLLEKIKGIEQKTGYKLDDHTAIKKAYEETFDHLSKK
jgi:hypothetical protein